MGAAAFAINSNTNAKGSPVWSVDPITLNLYLTDIPIWYSPPFGPELEVRLSYNSRADVISGAPFGDKWVFNYGSYLKDNGNTVKVFMPDGRKDVYTKVGSTYTAPTGVFNKLTNPGANKFELTFLDGTVYTYDIAGTSFADPHLVKIQDTYGNIQNITYNGTRILSVSNAAAPNDFLSFEYDTSGQHILNVYLKIANTTVKTAVFSYTGNSLSSVTDAGNYTTNYEYDGSNYIKYVKFPRPNDPDNPITWEFKIESSGGTNSTPYPAPDAPMGNNYRITITDPLNNKEEYFYTGPSTWHVKPNDYVPYESPYKNNRTHAKKTYHVIDRSVAKPRIKKIIYPEGGYVKYENFDVVTNKPQTITDYHGVENGQAVTHSTQYTYNANGLVTSITPQVGKATYIDYYPNNIDVQYIRRQDMTPKIELAFNAAHDITSFKDQVNPATTFEYETNGQLKKIIQPLSQVTTLEYDANHYLDKIKRGNINDLDPNTGRLPEANAVASFTYDSTGRVQTQTGPSGVTTTYEYNNLDKVTKVIFPDTKYIQINRSALHPHLIDSITDRNGLVTTYIHNALNQLTEVQGPIEGAANSYIYDYQYDKNGNLWKIIDMKKSPAAETVFEYNKDDLMTKKTYADNKFVTYAYDKMGQTKTFTNARNITTTYTFDANHNLKTITYSDATPAVAFEYDDYNRMTKRTDGTGVTDFTYLADDKIETVDGPLAGDKLTYHYNALGNLIDITPEQGQVVSYKYDYDTNIADIDLGRLKSITTGTNTYTYDYDGVNPLIRKLTRPNGSYTDYEYNDPLKRLTALINKASTGSLINSFAYTYEKDLIKTETVTNGTIIDNFLEKTTTYQTNAVNQLLSATTQGQTKNYAYDNDGNMTTGYTPEGYPLTMTYDAQNRMKTAEYNDGTDHLFQYSYAGNSLLAKMIQDGNETKYLRSGFLPIQERDVSNAITREYTWGTNLGGGIGGLLNLKQSGQDYSYLYDGKGNVSALIDSTQAVVASYAYDPFGQLMKKTGDVDQPYSFSTKEAQSGTGQYYYGYRFYDSCSGKWTTRDPLGEAGGMNLYGAVGNNAVNFIDTDGRFWQYAIPILAGGYIIYQGYQGFAPLIKAQQDTINSGDDIGKVFDPNTKEIDDSHLFKKCEGYRKNVGGVLAPAAANAAGAIPGTSGTGDVPTDNLGAVWGLIQDVATRYSDATRELWKKIWE